MPECGYCSQPMSAQNERFLDPAKAASLLSSLGHEFAVVENPAYLFPRFDLYPLPPRKQSLDRGLRAVVMDMDGTTTTTEALCIHSLETMVRRITGRSRDPNWKGLDRNRDYPHIIGNSTTKHVEYLVGAFKEEIDQQALRRATLHAAAWTLQFEMDAGRKREVRNHLALFGLPDLHHDPEFRECSEPDSPSTERLMKKWGDSFSLDDFSNIVRASIDIYYQQYHHILAKISSGNGDSLTEDLLPDRSKRLIEPMPAIGYFLALVKGVLGDQADFSREELTKLAVKEGGGAPDINGPDGDLKKLGQYFQTTPAQVGIVTSSIRFEADIVMGEVFRILREEVSGWDLPKDRIERILDLFGSPDACYDSFITASDSSEIRLKPHRDLYSLALHDLGVPPSDFDRVMGFEDSESGTIAIRGAGIPLCIAVPFSETKGHSFEAASHVCYGGIPEVVVKRKVFLPKNLFGD